MALTATYLSALHGQLSLVPKELSRIHPFSQSRKDVQDINFEYLLVSILSRGRSRVRGSCIRSHTRQPLLNDSTTCSGTAGFYAGECESDEILSGKECRIRGGRAIRGGEEAKGAGVKGCEESGG